MIKLVTILLIITTLPSLTRADTKQKADTQEQLKKMYLHKVSQLINTHKTNKQLFADWISLGDMARFRARINQPAVKIAVKPSLGPSASYAPGAQAINIKQAPAKFVTSFGFGPGSSALLWHEAIHAISHGHQIGAIKPSRPFKSAPKSIAPTGDGSLTIDGKPMGTIEKITPYGYQKALSKANEAIDHLYINWAESCMEGTQALVVLEKNLLKHGKDTDFLMARFWNAHLMITDLEVHGTIMDKGGISIKRRAPNPNFAKIIFKKLEALGMPPLIPGLITSKPKSK